MPPAMFSEGLSSRTWPVGSAFRRCGTPYCRDVARGSRVVLPTVTFLDPEIASVGLSEDEARERHGEDVLVHRWQMGDLDRAVADAEPDGFIKVVARANGRILGASIVAARAGEVISEFVLAMDQGFGLSELSTSVHAYPTWASGVQQVASAEAIDRFLSSRLGRLALRLSGLRAHSHGADE